MLKLECPGCLEELTELGTPSEGDEVLCDCCGMSLVFKDGELEEVEEDDDDDDEDYEWDEDEDDEEDDED